MQPDYSFNHTYFIEDEIEIYLIGSKIAPLSCYLCALFEILHNLEYALMTLPSAKIENSQNYYRIDIQNIYVTNTVNPNAVKLIVISEYGAELEYELLDGLYLQLNQNNAQPTT